MEERTKMNDNELTLTDILLYIKRFFVKIMARGIVTIVLILAVALLVWLLLPYKMRYYTELENTLTKTSDDTYVYPNKRAFNTSDVISPVVLRSIYNQVKLEDKIPYTDFASLFYIDNSSLKQARLDAEYEAKLNKKNLNTVSLNLLEEEYNLKKSKLTNNIFRVNMNTHPALSKSDCIQILALVPKTWFRIYSKTEAAILPKVELDTWKKDYTESMKAKDGNLVILEKARIYNEQLMACCKSLNYMSDGKNITIDSGEYLEDIMLKLEHIQKFQISVYSQFVIMSSQLFTHYDKIFLVRSLKETNRRLMQIEENIEHSVRALEMLNATTPVKNASETVSKNNNSSTVNLEFNGSILSQITELVRNDVTNNIRQDIAKQVLAYGNQKALLTAEGKYIQDLLLEANKKKEPGKEFYTVAEFRNKLTALQDTLLDTAQKILKFRTKITEEYLSSRSFYKQASKHIKIHKEYAVPITKIVLALLAIGVICNIGIICWEFKFKFQR